MSNSSARPLLPLGTHRSSLAQAQSTTPTTPTTPTTQSQSRPLRSARETSSGTTNWFQQVPPAEPRASRGRADGVTSMQAKTVTPESPHEPKADAVLREQAKAVVAAADKCLDDLMFALLNKDFEAVPLACNAVTEALKPVVTGKARKAEEEANEAEESVRNAAEVQKGSKATGKKAVEAARELTAYRQELGMDAKTPGIAEFTADACGDRLWHLLPKLEDKQIRLLHRRLNTFLDSATAEQKGASQTAGAKNPVLQQLLFSVKAELLSRVMGESNDISDGKDISDYSKEELVVLRELTTSLDRMVRTGTPVDAVLPGTRFTRTDIRDIDEQAETLLNSIRKTASALKLVDGAGERLRGADLPGLKRLKGAIDFLIATSIQVSNVDLVGLQTVVSNRIRNVQHNKFEAQITSATTKSPSGVLKAKSLDAEGIKRLMKLITDFLEEGDLSPELAKAKGDVEAILNIFRSNAVDSFKDAFKAALDATGTDQAAQMLLQSLVVAKRSLNDFKAANWDGSVAGLSDWMENTVRIPKSAPPKFRNEKEMDALRDDLTHGDGRALRDLMAASSGSDAQFAVDYFGLLNNLLYVMLDGQSAPSASSNFRAAKLTAGGLKALQAELNLTVKNGQLVPFAAVAHAANPGAPKPQQQKN